MKTIVKKFLLFLSLLFIAVSCSNNDDESNNSNNNIEPYLVKYEVTGNFSRPLVIRFTPRKGGVVVEENITALPWSKELIIAPSAKSVELFISGTGGNTAETVVAKIYIDNVERGKSTATSNSGSISSSVSHNF
jgi:hypothetical protein